MGVQLRRGTLLVVALLVVGASLLGGGMIGFRVWLQTQPHRGGVYCVAISPDEKLVATGGEDRTVKLWDAESLGLEPASRARRTFFGQRASVGYVAFVESGSRVTSLTYDQARCTWNVATGDVTEKASGERQSLRFYASAPLPRIVEARLQELQLPATFGRPINAAIAPSGRWAAVAFARDADSSAHLPGFGTVLRVELSPR